MVKTLLGMFTLLQSCAVPVSHAPIYVQPTVTYTNTIHERVVVKEKFTPIAVPIIVPAVTFQYLPALAPQAPAVAVEAQAPAVQAQPQQDMNAVIAEKVEKAVKARLGSVASPSDDGPPPLILPAELAAPAKEPPAAAGNDEQEGVKILANNCASCHTAGVKTSGNVTLFTKKDGKMYFQPSVEHKTILEVLSPPSPTMPPAANLDPNSPAAIKGRNLEVLKRWLSK